MKALLISLLLAFAGGHHPPRPPHPPHPPRHHHHHQRRCYATGLTRCLRIPGLLPFQGSEPPPVVVVWS